MQISITCTHSHDNIDNKMTHLTDDRNHEIVIMCVNKFSNDTREKKRQSQLEPIFWLMI